MEISKKPNILPWMSKDEVAFREKVAPNIFSRIGEGNNLLKEAEFIGYFDNGIESVVGLFKSNQKFIVAKTKLDPRDLKFEYKVLNLLRQHSLNFVKPLGYISVGDHEIMLIEYISEERAKISVESNPRVAINIATEVGKTLAKLHSIEVPGYGQTKFADEELTGTIDSFDQLLQKDFTNVIDSSYSAHYKSFNFDRLISLHKQTFKKGRLVHMDLGLHNIFGEENIVVLDGRFFSHNPLVDLAISYIWFHYLGNDVSMALINNYQNQVNYWDSELFQLALEYACYHKLEKWLGRVKTEKKVKSWINGIADIFSQELEKTPNL